MTVDQLIQFLQTIPATDRARPVYALDADYAEPHPVSIGNLPRFSTVHDGISEIKVLIIEGDIQG